MERIELNNGSPYRVFLEHEPQGVVLEARNTLKGLVKIFSPLNQISRFESGPRS